MKVRNPVYTTCFPSSQISAIFMPKLIKHCAFGRLQRCFWPENFIYEQNYFIAMWRAKCNSHTSISLWNKCWENYVDFTNKTKFPGWKHIREMCSNKSSNMTWRLHFIGSSSSPENPKTFVYVENPSMHRFPPPRLFVNRILLGLMLMRSQDLAASLKTLYTRVETRDLLYAWSPS